MTEQPGLPALLSHSLVAFTIEVDNAFEQAMPHTTTAFGPGGPPPPRSSSSRPMRRPWLVSLAMWSNAMRRVPPEGASLAGLAPFPPALARWGYVTIEGDGAPPGRTVRPTRAGRYAQEVWRRLVPAVERRWATRFGDRRVAEVRDALTAVCARVGPGEPPRYLPVVSYSNGMRTVPAERPARRGRGVPSPAAPEVRAAPEAHERGLSELLAVVLWAYTVQYEREASLSLPIAANVLRVLAPGGVPARELPRRAGVSREAATGSVAHLVRHGLALVEPEPGARRGKAVRLTARGEASQEAHQRRASSLQAEWAAGVGDDLARLQQGLRELLGEGEALAEGLRPAAQGWRARGPYAAQTRALLADPAGALPRHPVVLHRGGFPDGS